MMLSLRVLPIGFARPATRPFAAVQVRPPRQVVVSAFLDASDPPAKKKQRRAKADPDRIKRAPSAYNLYFKAAFPAVKSKAAEGTKAVELTATLSQMWKALSADQKAPYEAEANKLKGEVAAKRAAAKAEAKKHARPVTPYANYVSANFARVSASAPDAKTTDVVKLISAEWKKLPDNKKSSLLSEYREKLAAWKAINEPTV